MQRAGYKTAILDADITGPSIPKTFKLEEKAVANELGIFPVKTKTGIETMSVNSIPVSYTHLDVYKRQGQGGLEEVVSIIAMAQTGIAVLLLAYVCTRYLLFFLRVGSTKE